MKKKLSLKLTVFTATLVTVTMTVLIAIAVFLSSGSVSSGTNGEMSAIAGQNSVQIQSMLNEASQAADDLRAFIVSNYTGSAHDEETQPSSLYPEKLTPSSKAIESYAIESGWRKVQSSKSLIGLGMFFEPYAFDSDIEHYAIYIDENMSQSKTVSMYTDDYTTQAYYKDAVSKNQVVITEPFTWNGIYMVSIAYPVTINGRVVGAVISDISMDSFGLIELSNTSHQSMYSGIVSESGTVMFDSKNPDTIGSSFQSQFSNAEVYGQISHNFEQGKAFSIQTTNSDGKSAKRFFEPISLSSATWWSQTVISSDDFNSASLRLSIWLIAVALAAVAVIITVFYITTKRELDPIRYIVGSAKKIENGDLDITLDVKSENEIGQLALSFKNMSEGLRLIIGDINRVLTSMAANNFSVNSGNAESYVGEYASIHVSLRNIKSTLNDTLLRIKTSSEQVSSGSNQVSSGAQTLAQGATEQASSIEELSASITMVSAQIGETAQNSESATGITNEVSTVIGTSLSEMHQLLEAMSDISSASSNIGKVIRDIDDIAFQTNILALNAAVEAARAGTAGKGFAVVAEEVRNLAQKSAESAKNTTSLIESVVSAIGRGVVFANNANHAFEEVNEKASSMRTLVTDISSAAAAQAESIRQIQIGVEQISNVIQMNSSTAEESAAASEELSAQANTLLNLASQFELDSEG